MGRKNDLTKVVGRKLCPVAPVQSAGGRWVYPWAHMEPGHVFELRDPSARARSAMSAAASQWSRGTGAVFATGKSWEEINGWMTHVGWWCCRIDGVEIEPPDPTFKQQEAAEAYAARQAARRKQYVDDGKTSVCGGRGSSRPGRWSRRPSGASRWPLRASTPNGTSRVSRGRCFERRPNGAVRGHCTRRPQVRPDAIGRCRLCAPATRPVG